MIAARSAPHVAQLQWPPGFEVHALKGRLSVPPQARGLMVIPFLDSRAGGRVGRALDRALQGAGFATCHVSLLDTGESADARKTSQVPFLVHRLTAALAFLAARPSVAALPLGLLGSHRMAGVVLAAAARHPGWVRTVLCHCGCEMTAVDASAVRAPTILIVPGRDRALLAANEEAFWELRCPSQLAVVGGASRHFAEGGTLLACRQLVARWCRRHLSRRHGPCSGSRPSPR